MKIQLIVLLALSLCVTSRDYDDDEGRPYEFGFTIDGQQHRHESKDVNGIVMGEFGFITADGIYHVTVYATDENGSFKILSMRNVRVSGPLDEPGYEFPSKTSAAVQQPQPQNNPPPPPLPTTTLAPTTNFKAPYAFTTLPSLNVPSCSSCKLPSTTPKAPGSSNKLPFQTPEFQDKRPNNQIPPAALPILPFKNPPVVPQNQVINKPVVPQNQPFNNLPLPPPRLPFNNNPTSVPQNKPINNLPVPNLPFNNIPAAPSSVPFNPNVPKRKPENLENYGTQNPVKPSVEQQPPFQSPVNNYPSNDIPVHPSPFNPTHENLQNPPNPGVQTPVKIPDQFSKPANLNFPNPGAISLPKPPPVSVSDHQINIPGRDPIPIKDPYPNMVDGLPIGITENDMLDILYKFNYTLGFHGHHERGLKNGAKIGAYFVNGRDGIMRVVEYIADENGYRPKVKFINLGFDSPDTPKEGSEKTFELKGFEFVWYPI